MFNFTYAIIMVVLGAAANRIMIAVIPFWIAILYFGFNFGIEWALLSFAEGFVGYMLAGGNRTSVAFRR